MTEASARIPSRTATPPQRLRALAATAGLTSALSAAVLALSGGAAPPHALAQDGACPNAELRTGPSANLPDCRSYEQVSPVGKNDTDIGSIDNAGVLFSSPDGGAAAYTSFGAFAGSQTAALPNVYASTRGAESWQTLPLSPPIAQQPILGTISFPLGASADFDVQLVTSAAALAPGAIDGEVNVYTHDSSEGSYELVGTTGSTTANLATEFGGASDDGSHFFHQSRFRLEPDTTPPAPAGVSRNLYEWSNGELKLVGILPDGSVNAGGSVSAGGGLTTNQTARNAVSDDGRRVYWQPSGAGDPSIGPTYLRDDAQTTVLVSELHSDGSAQPSRFWYATPDGSHAFITSDVQLTSNASPFGADLYRYDADADELTDLTPDATEAEVLGVLGVSDDGSFAYFVAEGALAGGATAGEPNLYAWHDDGQTEEIRFIGTPSDGAEIVDPLTSEGVGDWRVSPNGRFLGFTTSAGTGGPNPQPAQPFRQAYLYDFDGDSLACASCPPGGAQPTGDARLQQELNPAANFAFQQSLAGLTRNILGTGQFFFESPDPLVGADGNSRRDVYEYQDGDVQLISAGASAAPSFFGDASLSGEDVFFLTRSRLVGQDQDDLLDLYDARVGGGIASQNPQPPPPGCEGEECQGEPSAPPAADSPASASLSGPENVAAGNDNCQKLDRKAKRAKRKASRAKRKLRRARKAGNDSRVKRLKRQRNHTANRAKRTQRRANRCKRQQREGK